jgi:hypothetical protein
MVCLRNICINTLHKEDSDDDDDDDDDNNNNKIIISIFASMLLSIEIGTYPKKSQYNSTHINLKCII